MAHPNSIRMLKGLFALGAACLAVAGHAAPGDTTTINGTARALVVQPPQVEAIDDLRFGTIMSPPANATVTVSHTGAVTSALDLTAFPSVRAPARFLVIGERNSRFVTTVSPSFLITNANGTAMTVNNVTFTRPASGGNGQNQFNRTNQNGVFNLYVGGTLNVRANQEAGTYSGEFEVVVVFL